jgi:hypothetical protein
MASLLSADPLSKAETDANPAHGDCGPANTIAISLMPTHGGIALISIKTPFDRDQRHDAPICPNKNQCGLITQIC